MYSPAPTQPGGRGLTPTAYGDAMIYGLGIFFFVAILLIAAFVKVKKRDAAYGRGEGFEE